MNESIGERLREAREQRQLSLQQASETTKVRAHYLEALEDDDLSAMPSTAQARGFLRIYAEFLGLQVADLVPPGPSAAPTQPPEPSVGSVPAPTQSAASAAKPSRSGLLDTARDLLSRRGKRGSTPAPAQSAAAAESTGNGLGPGGSADDSLNSAKKKVTE